MIRRWLAALSAAALIAAVQAASAATYPVSLSDGAFDPDALIVAPGDRILFRWEDGPHNVRAYAGDTFDSGTRSAGATYAYVYAGGDSVWFRCTLHSTLSEDEVCDGMCGRILQDPLDLLPPSVVIERPAERSIVTPAIEPDLGALLAPVLIEGAAGDNVAVLGVNLRIYDTLGRASVVATECEGCGSRVARWKHHAFLAPGSYVVEAIASDPSGNTRTSNRRTFVVV